MDRKRNNYRNVGTVYENEAVLFLQKKGYEILERNFYSRHGEIDIIAKDEQYIVFIEVKYRKKNQAGNALYAINRKKQQKILHTAKWYLLREYNCLEIACRFDVLAFDGDVLTHIENAFC